MFFNSGSVTGFDDWKKFCDLHEGSITARETETGRCRPWKRKIHLQVGKIVLFKSVRNIMIRICDLHYLWIWPLIAVVTDVFLSLSTECLQNFAAQLLTVKIKTKGLTNSFKLSRLLLYSHQKVSCFFLSYWLSLKFYLQLINCFLKKNYHISSI